MSSEGKWRVSFVAGGQSLSEVPNSEWLHQIATGLGETGLIELVPPNDPSSHLFVSLDLNLKFLFQSLRWQSCERVLLLAEPEMIRPVQYRSLALNRFDRVLSPSPLYPPANGRVDDFYRWSTWWPQPESPRRPVGSRIPGVGMIAGDKFSYVRGEQYELRRKVIECWPSRQSLPLVVAGTGWFRTHAEIARVVLIEALRALLAGHLPKRLFQSFRRRMNISRSPILLGNFEGHQTEFLRQFEYALVIENEASIVTEKFWQAIEAGCIPIYLGPDLTLFGLPEKAAIQMNSLDELWMFRPDSISKSQKATILNAGRELLSRSGDWTFAYTVNNIASKVVSLLRSQPS